MAKVNNNKSYQWLKLIITKVTNKSKKPDYLKCLLGITSELNSGACYLYSNIFGDLRKVS